MAKKTTKKVNPKNIAKERLLNALKNWTEEMFTVFDNEDFASNLTASTFVVDVDGVDVKVALSTPNGAAENTRYEREEGVEYPEENCEKETPTESVSENLIAEAE